MLEPSPLDLDVLLTMRRIIAGAIATERMGIAEAAAEARGLARGRHPALPVTVIEDAVAEILGELGANVAPLPPTEHDGQPLRAADPKDVAATLAYAMRFDARGKPRRTGWEFVASLAASQLVQHLEMSGFVFMRRTPAPRHSTSGPHPADG